MLKECGYVKEMENKCNYKYFLCIVLFIGSVVTLQLRVACGSAFGGVWGGGGWC